jgi:hypothetical protein
MAVAMVNEHAIVRTYFLRLPHLYLYSLHPLLLTFRGVGVCFF